MKPAISLRVSISAVTLAFAVCLPVQARETGRSRLLARSSRRPRPARNSSMQDYSALQARALSEIHTPRRFSASFLDSWCQLKSPGAIP
jgi:hypothetical protein